MTNMSNDVLDEYMIFKDVGHLVNSRTHVYNERTLAILQILEQEGIERTFEIHGVGVALRHSACFASLGFVQWFLGTSHPECSPT
jgi:hypothetical protein